MLTMLDILVLALVGGGAVLGLMRGFVTETLSLLAWVAAIVALTLLHTPATRALTGVTHSASGAAALAFVLLFGVTYFAGKMVARALGRRTRQSVLGPLDRLLGLGFGALKGLLVATLIFLAMNLGYDFVYGASAARPASLSRSRSYSLLNASGHAIVDFVQARRGVAPADNAADPSNGAGPSRDDGSSKRP